MWYATWILSDQHIIADMLARTISIAPFQAGVAARAAPRRPIADPKEGHLSPEVGHSEIEKETITEFVELHRGLKYKAAATLSGHRDWLHRIGIHPSSR